MIKRLCLIIAMLEILITFRGGYPIIKQLSLNTQNVLWTMFIKVSVVSFFILNWLGALGLYKEKLWGFIFSYLAIIFSTFMFSMSYLPNVPFITLEALKYRVILLFIENFSIFALVFFLHIRFYRISGQTRQ